MNGLMDPSPRDIKSMELVRKMKSKFEGSKYTTNAINSKPVLYSQDSISKIDVGQLSKQMNFEEQISVNVKNKTEMQNQINKVYTKLTDIENGVARKTKEMSRKIDELKVSFESNFSELVEKLNELRLDNKIIIQVLFDLDKNIGSARSLQNDIVEELEDNELDDEKVVASDSYIRETLKKLEEVNAELDEQKNRASSFSGNRDDLIYLDVEHRLLEAVMKVDVIHSRGSQEIGEKKKEMIERSDKIKQILDSNFASSM